MSYLKYYAEENARHPVPHGTRCSEDEAAKAIRRLWLHFAGRKALGQRVWDAEKRAVVIKGHVPSLIFTSGNRRSRARLYRITLNTDGLNWLLVLHELAHSLDHLREHQGRRSSEARWHSKHHARWVDRLVGYVTAQGWLTGNLAHELALRDLVLQERHRAAARGPSLDERIAHREEQVARLEKRIRALTTRAKTARRSLAALQRSRARVSAEALS